MVQNQIGTQSLEKKKIYFTLWIVAWENTLGYEL